MNLPLRLEPGELAIVRAILARHLPEGVEVYAFGSRAGGNPKPWSDLDLALYGAEPIPIAVLAELAEAFDESALPWKVDLIDRATASAAFGRMIDKAKVPLSL